MKLPFLPTAKDVLTKPEEFFEKDLSRIKRWQQPVTYLLFLIIISTFFMSGQVKRLFIQMTDYLVDSLGIQELIIGLPASTAGIAGLFLILVIILLLATSFKYWVAHWYIKLWNPKATFKNTYAVLTYGGTPGWLAIPFSGVTIYFIARATIPGGLPRHWLLAVLFGIPWILLEGYSIYLRVYALAKIQGIKRWQAVMSVYVLGLLTYLFGVLIIEFIIISIMLLFLLLIGVL